MAPSVILLLAAALLFIALAGVGVAYAVGRRSRAFPSCGRCGYDVTGSAASERCPECGTPYTEGGIIPARRSRGAGRGLVIAATAVLLLLVIGAGGSALISTAASRRAAAMQATAAQSRLRAQAVEADLLARMAGLDAEARAAADERRAARVRAFGIALATPEPDDPTGARIESIRDGSPADRAGFEPGDYVVAWAGESIADGDALARRLDTMDADEVIAVKTQRAGMIITLTVSPDASR